MSRKGFDARIDEAKAIEAIRNHGGEYLKRYKPQSVTYRMCLAAVEYDGSAIFYVPEEHRTEEMYRIACKTFGACLRIVPDAYMSEEICKTAVSIDGKSIQYVPEQYRTADIFLAAARNNPLVMQRMPVEMLTVDFCVAVGKKQGAAVVGLLPKSHKTGKFYLQLVQAYPDFFFHLPKSARTAKVCRTAITGMGHNSIAEAVAKRPQLLHLLHTSLYDHDTCLAYARAVFVNGASDQPAATGSANHHQLQSNFEVVCSVPHLLRWHDVCEIVIPARPLSLRYVPDELLTYELCLSAVTKDYGAFDFVPDRYKTQELCMLAFARDPYSMTQFPEEFITYDLCLAAVRRSGYLLEKIPQKYRSYEVCLTAVKRVPSSISDVPTDVLDEGICLAAFRCKGGPAYTCGILSQIPEHLRTYPVCLAAANSDGGCFGYIPSQYRTYEICLAAAKRDCRIGPLPESYYTEELCLELIKTANVAFSSIPKTRLTEKICLHALGNCSRYETVLGEIPVEMRTPEMCDFALSKSVWAFKFIPDAYVTFEMLMNVAERAPGRLEDNFPQRFRTPDFYRRIVDAYPDAKRYLDHIFDAEKTLVIANGRVYIREMP